MSFPTASNIKTTAMLPYNIVEYIIMMHCPVKETAITSVFWQPALPSSGESKLHFSDLAATCQPQEKGGYQIQAARHIQENVGHKTQAARHTPQHNKNLKTLVWNSHIRTFLTSYLMISLNLSLRKNIAHPSIMYWLAVYTWTSTKYSYPDVKKVWKKGLFL